MKILLLIQRLKINQNLILLFQYELMFIFQTLRNQLISNSVIVLYSLQKKVELYKEKITKIKTIDIKNDHCIK